MRLFGQSRQDIGYRIYLCEEEEEEEGRFISRDWLDLPPKVAWFGRQDSLLSPAALILKFSQDSFRIFGRFCCCCCWWCCCCCCCRNRSCVLPDKRMLRCFLPSFLLMGSRFFSSIVGIEYWSLRSCWSCKKISIVVSLEVFRIEMFGRICGVVSVGFWGFHGILWWVLRILEETRWIL